MPAIMTNAMVIKDREKLDPADSNPSFSLFSFEWVEVSRMLAGVRAFDAGSLATMAADSHLPLVKRTSDHFMEKIL